MEPTENTGHIALRSMSFAPSFNKWMYTIIAPFAKGKILEIGSGMGNISRHFLHANSTITLSDIDEYYIRHLKEEFQELHLGNSLLSIDLQKENFGINYSELKEKFDTVILLNVLEHLEDESEAIQNCKFLLKNNGSLIILVPAYTFLFSEMDKALNHCRRYTVNSLVRKIENENLEIKKSFYFNVLGIGAWLFAKLMKYKSPPETSMKFYNKLTPFGKLLDKLVFNKTGLSVIVIATKNK